MLLPPSRHAIPLLWRGQDDVCRRQISQRERSFRGTTVGVTRQLHQAYPEWRKLGCPLVQRLLAESLSVGVFKKQV